jgi:hypothetical protein
MVGLYGAVVAQLALLITTNCIFLIYLFKTRPYLNNINLFFSLLFVLTAIVLESFYIYFYQHDKEMFAS